MEYLFFTKKNIHSVKNLNLSYCNDNNEACIVEINPNVGSKENSMLVAGIFKPPNSPISPLVDYIDGLFTEYSRREIIFTGDFNMDLLNEDASSHLCDVMFSYNIFPLINIATRITENTATCLDHVWYNGFNALFCGAFFADISDHYPVFAVLNVARNNRPLRKTIRDLSLKSVDSFISAMRLLLLKNLIKLAEIQK